MSLSFQRRRLYIGIVFGLLAGADVDAAVYRCTAPDVPPRFSQFPCPGTEVHELELLHTMTIPSLSEAERRLLDELEQQRLTDRALREQRRAAAADQADAARVERQHRCEEARTALDALKRQRRKGYTSSEARALDRRESELEAAERENC